MFKCTKDKLSKIFERSERDRRGKCKKTPII